MSSHISAEQARLNQRALMRSAFLKSQNQPRELAAPEVPDALPPDNLLPKDILLSGLPVTIPGWERPLAGDQLFIYWDEAIVELTQINDPTTELPYKFTISPDKLLGDGIFPLYYKVMAASGSESDSATVMIKIDRTPPNQNNVPQALVFDAEVMSEGLTVEYLEANNDQVPAYVPEYTDMQAGETVHAFWDEIPLEPITLTEADVTAKKVPVIISGDIVREAGQGTILADYYLTSRAGFDGLPSLASTINVLLTPKPTNLKAPIVPLAEDPAGIDLQDANTGVVVQIDEYQNATATDLVVAKWGNTNLSPALVIPGEFPILVSVPRSTIINEGSGEREVSYIVSRGGLNFDAPPITVKVDVETVGPTDPDPGTPENEALEPAVLTSASGLTNELVGEDQGQSASVQIALYEGANPGDKVTLYWGNTPPTEAGSLLVSEAEISAGELTPIAIDAGIISATPDNPAWPLYYTLSLPLKPGNAIASPITPINVHMSSPGGLEGLDPLTYPDANANGWLLTELVENGANLFVAVYENMKLGDIVTLTWQAYSSTNAAPGTEVDGTLYTTQKTVAEPEMANGISFVVPYDYIKPIAEVSPTLQGSGIGSYTVTQGGSDTSSPDALVKIELGHP
jgi:hypothetical protein